MATCNWSGYAFTIYEMGGLWKAVGGVFIFAGPGTEPGKWKAYYVGTCDSFKDRCPNHEQWPEALQLGATHVHARVVSLQLDRDSIEKELILEYQPPLNTDDTYASRSA